VKRGDLVVRNGIKGTVTRCADDGWVVVGDFSPTEDDMIPVASAGYGGDTPERAGWMLDPSAVVAPDLLARLEWCIARLDECGGQTVFTLGMTRSLDDCRAAVANARGSG
jgi:hypothetical protein